MFFPAVRTAVFNLAALTICPTFLIAQLPCPAVALPPAQVEYVISGTRILEFDSFGNFITQFGGTGFGPGQFQLPSGIAVDSSGFVYVTDALLNRVQKFDSCGNLLVRFGSTGVAPGFLYQPYGIAVDRFGNIWIVDTGNNRIQAFNGAGGFEMQFGGLGGGNGQFAGPVGISLGSPVFGNSLWVADTGNNRIQQFIISYAGTLPTSVAFSLKFGSYGSGNGQFRGPFSVVASNAPFGPVYVADSLNQRIQDFTPDGTFVRAIGPFSYQSPYGIALSMDFNVWAVDYNTNTVALFTGPGVKSLSFGTKGGGPGQLINPTYIAAGPSTSITSITARVGNLLGSGGAGGVQGLYLKQVNGSVLANLNDTYVYEPASSVKVLAHLYAMTKVQNGAATLNQTLTHYLNLPDSCPNPPSISGTEPLSTVLREMMWHSDNARTREVIDTFGMSNINSFAASIGLAHTSINQIIGCVPPPFNQFTLDDAGTLYEGVANLTLLNATNRDTFYSLMAGKAQYQTEGYDWTHIWDTDVPNIINQEAPPGTTTAQKQMYQNSMNLAYKAGGYVVCQSDCSHILQYLSLSGWFKVPFCGGTSTISREYVFGIFISGAPDNSWFAGKTTAADSTFTNTKGELLREPIRAGMASCYGSV